MHPIPNTDTKCNNDLKERVITKNLFLDGNIGSDLHGFGLLNFLNIWHKTPK